METMMIADVPISAQTAIIALTKIGSMRVVSTDITTTAPTAVQRWMVMGMRLIDADALMDEFRRFMAKEFDKVKCISEENCNNCKGGCLWYRNVKKAQTVDAMEVVRCKDCEHCRTFIMSHNKEAHTRCSFWGEEYLLVKPDDFCSYGERKDNETV